MEKPCNKSILAQHAHRNQQRVCKAGGQDSKGEFDQLIFFFAVFAHSVLTAMHGPDRDWLTDKTGNTFPYKMIFFLTVFDQTRPSSQTLGLLI